MKTIEFSVAGDPKGQPRPRAFARNFGAGKWAARVYDPGTAEGWKSQIAITAKPFIPEQPMEGPIDVRLTFAFRRPKGHLRSNGELKPSAPVRHCKKPDCDNLAKAVLDALTQIGFWRDDCQIEILRVEKNWSLTTYHAGVNINIKEICQ